MQPEPGLPQARGTLVIEGVALRCVLELQANGGVHVEDMCKTAEPALGRVKHWLMKPPGLWLLDDAGAPVFTLSKDRASLVYRQVMPDGRTVLFYPFAAEAAPRKEGLD